jgi:hypothetical protein
LSNLHYVDPSGPWNFRDLAGLRTADGGTVRPGVLYRSETLARHAPPPLAAPRWPPSTVIDLRLADREHELAGTGAVIHRMPMAPWLDPEALSRDAAGGPVDLVDRYLRMIHNSHGAIADLVDLVSAAGGPVLVHCTLGKDRTGIVVALLLAAVGVSREDIIADYERTHDNMPAVLAALRERGQKLPDNEALLEVSPAALSAVLDAIYDGSVSADRWLHARGVTVESARRLRSRLVEPADLDDLGDVESRTVATGA